MSTLHLDANYLAVTLIRQETTTFVFQEWNLKDLPEVNNELAWKCFRINTLTSCPKRTVATPFGGKLSLALKHNPPVWKKKKNRKKKMEIYIFVSITFLFLSCNTISILLLTKMFGLLQSQDLLTLMNVCSHLTHLWITNMKNALKM